MNQNQEAELKALQQALVKNTFISAPSTIMVGVGIFGLFAPDASSLHPVLGNQPIVIAMLIAGGVGMVWTSIRTISINNRRNALLKS